jgi:hypothetical protein
MGSDLMTLVMQAATETGFIRKDEKTGEMIGTGEVRYARLPEVGCHP